MDLFEIEFDAKDVDAATRGLVNSGVLRSWVSRGYLQGPLVHPRQKGRAAKYSIVEIYLMAIAAELRQIGLPMRSAVYLATQWTTGFMKGKHTHYVFWRPNEDDLIEEDDYRMVPGEDYPTFDPFESLGEAIAGLRVLPVIQRVDRILIEGHGSEDAAA